MSQYPIVLHLPEIAKTCGAIPKLVLKNTGIEIQDKTHGLDTPFLTNYFLKKYMASWYKWSLMK